MMNRKGKKETFASGCRNVAFGLFWKRLERGTKPQPEKPLPKLDVDKGFNGRHVIGPRAQLGSASCLDLGSILTINEPGKERKNK